MNSLFDKILLPRRVYKRLTEKRATLYLGIIFVGVIDILSPQVIEKFPDMFLKKSIASVLINALIVIGLVVLTGLMDTVFFSVPMSDLFNKVFKKQKEFKGNSLVKVMKIYILAHVITLPANLILYFLFKNENLDERILLVYLAAYGGMLLILWFNGIISRGINSIFKFEPIFRVLVFPVIFVWNMLLSVSLQYVITNWVIKLLV